MKLAVLKNYEGRCAYRQGERRCACTEHLEMDHIITIVDGGQTLVENLRPLCFAHNQLMAPRRFGNLF